MKRLISILLVLVFAVSLFAGSALAAAGDASGIFGDFPFVYFYSGGLRTISAGTSFVLPCQQYFFSYDFSTICIFPYSLISGTFSFTDHPFLLDSSDTSSFSSYTITYFDVSGTQVGNVASLSTIPSGSISIPSGTRFLALSALKSTNTSSRCLSGNISYSDFVYDLSSGGSGSGDDLSQDILDGVEAIAQSLLDLETGPYSGVTNISPNYDANGNFTGNTLTTSNNATLEGLLNALGISSTSSALYLKNLYDNWGNNFTYFLMDTPVTGGNLASEMIESAEYDLPTYIGLLGNDLSYAVQQMRRDNYAQQETWTQRYQWLYDRVDTLETTLSNDINAALYEDTDDTPAESWSVARWLKGIYDSVTGFFASFWSPAETAIKESNEDAMEAVTTNGIHTTVQNVNDAASMQSAITGLLPSGDINGFAPLQDTAFHSFWSEETHEAMLPPSAESESTPSNSRRLLSSSPPSSSAPVVDYSAYDRNQALARSLLGGD